MVVLLLTRAGAAAAAPYWETGKPVASQNASEGQDVVFQLKVKSDPPPTFTFYKNGKQLKDGDAMGRVSISGGELAIKSARKAKEGEFQDDYRDNAVYQALINNSHGSLWANFYLNLLAFEPIILDLPPEHSAVLGSDATIKCKVFGSPKPVVQWLGNSSTPLSSPLLLCMSIPSLPASCSYSLQFF